MLRTGFLLLALSTMAMAQQQPPAPPTQNAPAPTNVANHPGIPDTPRIAEFSQATYDDVYCGGFLAPTISQSSYVVGGWNTPDSTRYGTDDYIYLNGTYTEGSDYQILRRMRDSNRYETFKGQNAAVSAAGEMYAEMGRVHIKSIRGKVAIGHVDFSCDTIVPGDIVVPFRAKEIPVAHGPVNFDQFAVPNGKLTGRIIQARDFDYLVGTQLKVYLNIGADKGLKVGDYLRVTRTYGATRDDSIDGLSFKATVAEDTQLAPPKVMTSDVGDYPRRSLGELQITDVQAKSATAMVAFSLEPMYAGDMVELDELPPAIAKVEANNPPNITCTANPAAVRIGDMATINCEVSSPEDRPLSVVFQSTAGNLTTAGNSATLITTGVPPGPIDVLATATDDRNLSSSAHATVNVEGAPTAPAPGMVNSLAFKPNSAYVDNKAKAMLDDVALRMQNDPNSNIVLIGSQDESEPKGLAGKRAVNAKAYLVSKGIDAKRIDTRAATTPGAKADVWAVPAGAALPPEASSAQPTTETPTAPKAPRKKPAPKKTP